MTNQSIEATTAGRVLLAGLLCLSAPLLGCGPSGPPMGEVSGTVTVDSEPATGGYVTFIPADGVSSQAGGKIVDGRYTAEVTPGVSKIEIRVPKVVGETKLYGPNDSATQPVTAESLPAKYNDRTELTFDVQEGPNEKNFALEGK